MGKKAIYILRSIIKDVLGGVVRLAIDQGKLGEVILLKER